ncbi:hypothetical protein CDES_02300 [Corynebacterium deserti GIMN1.010]|uniref:Uncharacterized protein n=1 Tax=Corynebacterium deserti GIMN1.010 TaxID=931089 RepID=A0A0M4CW20_9CORY|nr:hypothetical protein [Corynebacterium deserti]ALC04920.1 hypothetical protein CDES_02300 [Corynebacterium deserti GIMN1.010]
MAELKIDNRSVTVRLSWWEKLSARRSHLTIPRRAIRNIEVIDNAISSVDHPLKRASRLRIPGFFVAGTHAYTTEVLDEACQEHEFSMCRKNVPGLVIELENISIDRIVISTPNAYQYAEELSVLV